jgi:hypothetical protein
MLEMEDIFLRFECLLLSIIKTEGQLVVTIITYYYCFMRIEDVLGPMRTER